MKHPVSRIGCAAVCISLSLALGCGCAVLPPASSKPASASSVPTDANGKPLYDASRLDDGKLRMLYGYDNTGNSSIVLCGGKVLYQSARSENVYLLQDTVTGETNYWFRSWSDPEGRGGRRSALYDKGGSEVMAFDGQQSAAMQNDLLVLQESRMLGDSYLDGYDSYGTCQVIDLSTGEALPAPDGAYGCIVCGDFLVYNCYARPADLAEDAWDDDPYLHSWVIVQTKDGAQTYRADSTSARFLSYDADNLTDWVELHTYSPHGDTIQTLYNPASGQALTGFGQVCGSGTAGFETDDGRYELRDLTAEDCGVISTFEDMPNYYFPGYVVTWSTDADHGFTLHDLETGEVTPLYSSSVSYNTIALYAEDGSLKVYSTDTGELITDTTAGPVEDGQVVRMDSEDNGYVWLELQDSESFELLSIRVYGPEGLVTDLTPLQGIYEYLSYLTTTPEGRPLYTGLYPGTGNYSGLVDVLDENGNIVIHGLGSCYSYYFTSWNQLPDHVFAAKRGFYYGWMDTDGNWLYCQNIFSTLSDDDEMGY